MKKEYSTEETATYIAERNKKRDLDRRLKKTGQLIWDSKKDGTFLGSVRETFLTENTLEQDS